MITKNQNFTAIDFETANWYRKSACSIGLVRVVNGVIVDEFYSLIKPTPEDFHPINTRIHGITSHMCKDAPTFGDLWQKIEPFIDGQLLVAHNVSFERSVLNHLFEEYKLNPQIKDYLCTLYLSRVYFSKMESHKLSNIYFNLFGKLLNHHNALEDAKASAEIVLRVLDERQIPCFERMVAALYEKPVEERISRKSIPFAQLQPDAGFEGISMLKGMNFTFTGELDRFSREEAAQFVVNRGGKANENVTKATTHLVVGGYNSLFGTDHKSTKLKKAQELNAKGAQISIIGGDEFLNLTTVH